MLVISAISSRLNAPLCINLSSAKCFMLLTLDLSAKFVVQSFSIVYCPTVQQTCWSLQISYFYPFFPYISPLSPVFTPTHLSLRLQCLGSQQLGVFPTSPRVTSPLSEVGFLPRMTYLKFAGAFSPHSISFQCGPFLCFRYLLCPTIYLNSHVTPHLDLFFHLSSEAISPNFKHLSPLSRELSSNTSSR